MGSRPYSNSGDIVVGIKVEMVVVVVGGAADDVLDDVGQNGGLRADNKLE